MLPLRIIRTCKTVHEVRSFLGLCSYYRRFIRHFAETAAPLHDLTKKNSIFKWGESQRSTFLTLKEKLTTEPILVVPDLYKSFEILMHAGIALELISIRKDMQWHMINSKKSEFFLEQIHYLRHIISKEGIRMDLAKIRAIQEQPELMMVHEVRNFLGLSLTTKGSSDTLLRSLHHYMT